MLPPANQMSISFLTFMETEVINSHGILTIDETEVFLYLYKFYNFELLLN